MSASDSETRRRCRSDNSASPQEDSDSCSHQGCVSNTTWLSVKLQLMVPLRLLNCVNKDSTCTAQPGAGGQVGVCNRSMCLWDSSDGIESVRNLSARNIQHAPAIRKATMKKRRRNSQKMRGRQPSTNSRKPKQVTTMESGLKTSTHPTTRQKR